MDDFTFAVLTVSDSCFNNSAEDTSGPCLERMVKQTFPTCKVAKEVIPDDKIVIEQALCKYADQQNVHAIFTTGGTGFSPRDYTPEATKSVVERECPQLILAMALESFHKTPFAALSRAAAGIRGKTLIVNFPGSLKAVRECFEAIKMILPHAIQLICDELKMVSTTHSNLQSESSGGHSCPHKTGSGGPGDRNSPFPMLAVPTTLDIIFDTVKKNHINTTFAEESRSPVNIPPFRASIKDGYALKSSGFSGTKKVVGYISAGDPINEYELKDDECFKINTGAPVPDTADCVIQVEDTKLLKTKKDGMEDLVTILVDPQALLDIRPIGCDLKLGQKIFPAFDTSDVVMKSLMASVGLEFEPRKPIVGIMSTGNELLQPLQPAEDGKIFDSNTTMLMQLLQYFGFECRQVSIIGDDFDSVKDKISGLFKQVDFIICTGGVSMGDKDYIKPVLLSLGLKIKFGRVNVKPGKPMTFASSNDKYFFGLPGNPVSAFVCFHIFVLPALRWSASCDRNKCTLPVILVKVENEKLKLDPRPEYVRASITSRNNELWANVTGDQMSSRLQSIVGADVLLQLPGRSELKDTVVKGEIIKASVLRYDFISKYE